MKNKCTHPPKKVTMRLAKWVGGLVVGRIDPCSGLGLPGKMETICEQQWFQCECGEIVEPKSFKKLKPQLEGE